jgi:two-component system, OmpR family, phosphate regulon sensor histidine kinase PhoR
MFGNKLSGTDIKTLRYWIIIFFLALVIPTAILIQQSYSRLKWETFHQHQLMADELARRIDNQFIQLIDKEEQRSFTDYVFLNVAGDPAANFFQRSPLSHYPVESDVPGMIGYFQVDSLGKLVTPLIPDVLEQATNYGITGVELTERIALQNKIQSILSQNRLLQNDRAFSKDERSESIDEKDAMVAEAESIVDSPTDLSDVIALENVPQSPYQGQAAFDALKTVPKKSKQESKLGRLEDLELEQRYQEELAERALAAEKEQRLARSKMVEKRARVESNVLPESVGTSSLSMKRDDDLNEEAEIITASPAIQSNLLPQRIYTFESEIDPFEFSQLDSGHFVLFRKVWLNDQRYIQGMLIGKQVFLAHIINATFRETSLSQMSNLLVVYQDNVLEAYTDQISRGYLSSVRELNGELLYQTRLSDPLSDMQLLFSLTQLPAGPGGTIIIWLALILAFVLCAGFYLMYRLGVKQINLSNQQQDFVSAVSHELKTPLTSIRMYGEILREGWAHEEKKKTYYDFIFDESERLSRLVNNVLHLARMSRNEQLVVLKKLTVTELMDGVQSKVSTQIERAGFELTMHCNEKVEQSMIEVDADWFTQIMINLVDNAIKFSARAEVKKIEVGYQNLSNNIIQFTVRDFGSGIDKQQMKKIFELFYRTENELTRETVGTGIGLALVHQMIVKMNGQIDIINKEPGAEFRVEFPAV